MVRLGMTGGRSENSLRDLRGYAFEAEGQVESLPKP